MLTATKLGGRHAIIARLISLSVLLAVLALTVIAQRPKPRMERLGDGFLIDVLPPDRIPAIDKPRFVPAAAAQAFMRDDEPVLGVFDGKVAKAYSLWLLDGHEIVNDSTPGYGAIAVTW